MNCIKLYRSIRPNEISYIRNGSGILPPCHPCFQEDTKCCKISANAHVNSGTRAKLKSRYVSFTKNPSIAALWSSTADGKCGTNTSGMFVEVCVPITLFGNKNKVIDVTKRTDLGLGATALNRAKASEEVLIKDGITISDVLYINMWNSKHILKRDYDNHPDLKIKNGIIVQTKFWGKKTRKDSNRYVVADLVYTNSK